MGGSGLAHEDNGRKPHVARERMEIRPVLKIVEVLVELVLPDDASCPIQVDELKQ